MLIIKNYLRTYRLKIVPTPLTVNYPFEASGFVVILTYMQTQQTIEQYMAKLPETTQHALQKVQAIIHQVTPNAQANISYGIPTYRDGKKVIHIGGYQEFISLYPGAAGIANFADRLKEYETSKGTVRFYLDKPIPYDLIREITIACFDSEQKD